MAVMACTAVAPAIETSDVSQHPVGAGIGACATGWGAGTDVGTAGVGTQAGPGWMAGCGAVCGLGGGGQDGNTGATGTGVTGAGTKAGPGAAGAGEAGVGGVGEGGGAGCKGETGWMSAPTLLTVPACKNMKSRINGCTAATVFGTAAGS